MVKTITRSVFVNKKTKQRSLVLPKEIFKKNEKAKKVTITIKEFIE